ncbi:cytochrome ubiquinol oxidase subunit I [Prosthecochloris sp. N3]|uniref:Cytochrome ubiquinol oxidase subunit I n=1 Tax=Prosthecochloris ethylica TaxID=2743976 RepID=A0ABR9XTX9_9CHLB|nr:MULTISPECIES: cytochrome ubiquinol oxidase subunit I [Prosthecochloris]MBF0587192.1 cytochrome ubiquinol oxidase subunit I [Prosthecochloris ethylica]MBF0637270.1 cytochrome ubiquinol oxidase subunit I [Prosthecochloris ethylica]NUK48461.1 cytochrome ubiquinol oxidase subunit I [Prosthecochloris ethylica]RNA64545.1 cytochrome ubiquinol oxidase subunit I [Prosthecochloris sp. ZM_2]
MDALLLARLQFALTSVFHFFFVPLTLGLSLFVAIMETAWVRTGNEMYKRLAKFWGHIFLINFAVGVVTGIVMEFQFGLNWSEYSRFVGDIFGVPLAIEALLAFFLESVFLGIWIFGWERISKKLHAATIWIVAIASNLSALWILVANSFMQHPVGYRLAEDGSRAEMVDFWALLFNPHVWVQFPHVISGGMTTAAFLVMAISIYHIMKNQGDIEPFRKSLKYGAVYGFLGTVLVTLAGHTQMQDLLKRQPMKVAAAEALWETENPASFSLFTIGNEEELRDVFSIRVPGLLSFLAFNSFEGEVKGIKDLQAEYEETYGPGNYIPPIAISYWSFRLMVGAGTLMLVTAGLALFYVLRNRYDFPQWSTKLIFWSFLLPYLGNSAGWILAEMGRQPWIVFGLLRTEEAVSPASVVSSGELMFSMTVFVLIYALLTLVDIYLIRKYAAAGLHAESTEGRN